MANITWDQSLATDIPNIDHQHQKLVELVNKVGSAMKDSMGNEVLLEVVTELINYTKSHFRYEEQYMESIKYPKLAEHKQVHQMVTQQVSELYEKIKEGKYVSPVQVSNMLKEWISNHILKVDMHYAKYLKHIQKHQKAGV
ncbi:MAG: bacteriohemerythrin [Dehalococcoidales bacterium]|nr:bacteriohemerythrin [Dehalococcoidales bacterium]